MRRIVTAGAVGLALIALLSLSLPTSIAVKIHIAEIVVPVQRYAHDFSQGLGNVAIGIGRVIRAGRTNQRLEERLDFLVGEVIRLKEVEKENEALKALLEFKKEEPYSGIAARVVGRDIRHWNQSILINKGGVDGVRKDAPVVSPRGVVGKVIEVAPHISRVLLIVDANSRVGGVIQSSRLTGIVEGMADGRCTIRFLHRRSIIKPGEFVLTSGLGRIYPPGLLIGAITRVYSEKFGLYQYADLEPATDFDRLEQVMVLDREGA